MPEIGKELPQERKPSLSDAMGLSDRYGGIDNIPLDELRTIGYERTSPGHISPIGIAATREIAQREGHLSLEAKAKNAPFGEIGVSLIGKDVPFRRLSEQQVMELRKRFIAIHDSIDVSQQDPQDIVNDNIPAGYAIHALTREFERFTDSFQDSPELKTIETDELKNDIFYWWSLSPVLTNSSHFFAEPDIFIGDYTIEAGEWSVSSVQSENMNRALEQQKGILADRTQLDKLFTEEQKEVFPESFDDGYTIQNHYPSLAAYCQARGLTTHHAVTTHFFGRLLNSQGLTDLAQELQGAKSTPDAAAILTTKRDEALNSLVEEEEKT